jgi:hypothetical protein
LEGDKMFIRSLLILTTISALSFLPLQSQELTAAALAPNAKVAVWNPATGRQAIVPAQSFVSLRTYPKIMLSKI